MINALRTLLMNGLLVYVVCPSDEETAFVAAHIAVTGRQVGCMVTSPATLERGVAMLRVTSTMSAPVPLSELSWPLDSIAVHDPDAVRIWSTEATEALSVVLEVTEMEPKSLVVVVCENPRIAGALAQAIMEASQLEKGSTPPDSSKPTRVIESVNIPGGGPAFILGMEP